jgi:hypothetical protein
MMALAWRDRFRPHQTLAGEAFAQACTRFTPSEHCRFCHYLRRSEVVGRLRFELRNHGLTELIRSTERASPEVGGARDDWGDKAGQ